MKKNPKDPPRSLGAYQEAGIPVHLRPVSNVESAPSGASQRDRWQSEEIITGNKLIAVFMGYDKIPKGHYKEMNPELTYYGNMDSYGTVTNLMSENDLKYHTSLDWLIPAVQKIQSIDISPAPNYRGYHIEIVIQGYVKIEGSPMPPIFINVYREGSLIKAVWQAVVQFIQWYNSSKQSA